MITFDDGLKSVSRYAYPVLKQYGMKATAFIVTSRIKRHPQKWNPKSLQFMSVSELNEIRDVFDFQSHTHFLHRVDGYRRPILLSVVSTIFCLILHVHAALWRNLIRMSGIFRIRLADLMTTP